MDADPSETLFKRYFAENGYSRHRDIGTREQASPPCCEARLDPSRSNRVSGRPLGCSATYVLGLCVGPKLDRKCRRFLQSTAAIRSDQQTMMPFCDVSPISLRISAGRD